MFTTSLTSELRMTMTFFDPSSILVVRTPISTTVPLLEPTEMMSPTRNSPSKMMNSPLMMSDTSSLAPKLMAMDRMPAEAKSVVVSTPTSARQ